MPKKKSSFFKVKPVLNKKNGQINISLPKKKLPSKVKNNIKKMGSIDIKIKGINIKKKLGGE